MWKYRYTATVLLSAIMVLWGAAAKAGEATIGVASNFLETAEKLEARFEAETGHRLLLASGSTGQLFAKTVNGAPFDVFLAADQERPARLVTKGVAQPDSQFTYAVGLLTLYAADPDLVQGPDVLSGPFRALSIANPRTAPYGTAAWQVLEALQVADHVSDRTAQAQNVTGAFAAVRSGAAELGFVALASVLSERNNQPGSRWDPPQDLYAPLRQDVVLLRRGQGNPAAESFLAFLRSPEAAEIMRRFGYRQADP